MKTNKKMKKIMYGLIKSWEHSYQGKRKIVFEREMTTSDCCCAEEGYVLYDTKKQAKESYVYRKEPCKLVKYTMGVLESNNLE